MHKLSYKSLFIIFFFLLIGVVVLSRFVLPNKKVSASWWNESWSYRKAISITNSSGSNQNNIQIKILDNYDLSALVTAGKIQPDLDDLRFTDINGNLINYWIEDSTNNSVDVWGFVPSLPSSGTSIYMYYGNLSANSISSTTNITIGGTMTSIGGYRIHTFKGNGTLTNAKTENAEVLVVAGGGGGGSSTGAGGGGAGGGGAGGLIYNSSYSLTQGQTINITVGTGGTNGATSTNQTGTNGGDSVFNTITATGGGGGARTATNGNNGGSGGGAGYNQYTTIRYGGNGTTGIGNSGGNTSNLSYAGGGGGGGAGGVGGDNKTGHNGGDGGLGLSYSITGVGITYATGGRGGGGSGPLNKTANTGNGGDGSYANTIPTSGASGIIVVRYISGTANTPASTEEAGGGPVAYWKFDEGIGTTAYNSAGSNNGVLLGTTRPVWTDAVSNTGIAFSGVGDYLSLPYRPNFREALTVSVWIKRTTDFNQLADVMLLSPPSAWYFYDSYNSGAIRGDVYIDGTRRGGINVPVPFDGNWYQITYTYDSATHFAKMYKNGKLYQSTEITGLGNYLIDAATGNLYNFGSNSLGRGLILDEPKIYNYARTADQIKQDYNSRGSSKGSSVNLGVKSSTAPSPRSSLVGHWKFDENNGSTVYDSSGNNKNGTLSSGTSSPSWNNNGHSNKSLSFDGNDSITLANEIVSTSSIRTNGVTYSAWIKANNTSGTQKIVGQKPSSGYSDLASGGIDISSGKARMIAYDDNISYKYATGNTTLNSDQWYLITGVYDPSDQKIKIYVNGKFDGGETTITTFNRLISNDYNLIGSHNYTSSFFNGLIDEVKIYNRNLTDNEIKQEYNSGSAVQFGSTNQTIGGTTTSLEYCIPGDTTYCASPIAEWNFEENTGTIAKDISGNNNTGNFGTGSSSPTWTIGKKNTGAGLNFDGKQFITVQDNSILKPTTSITAQAWFSTTNKSLQQKIISKTEGSGYQLSINENVACATNTLCFVLNINGTYYTATYPSSNLTNNTWYHVAGTYNGTTVKLFLNGISIGTTSTISNTITQGTAPLCIGSEPSTTCQNGGGTYFSGKIDNIKIYDYARTPAQVAYDYSKGAPIAHWKLDECQGLTAFDSSGSGYTGAISIGPSGSQTTAGTCQVGTSAAWTNGASGKINSSLNFDGSDDYIFISYSNSWKSQNISLSFWLNAKSYTDIETNYASHWFYSPDGFGIAGNSSAWINTSSGRQYLSGCNFNNANKWTHISLTYNQDNGSGQFYVDSKLKCSISLTPGTSIAWNGSSGIYLGGAGDDSYNGPGQIDDVRIYNYALTSEQVKTVYNNGSVNFR